MSREQAEFIAWRYYLILIFILLVVCGLFFRIFNLTILDQHFLRQQGDQRMLRLVSKPAFRGMIVDRNNFPLAVSTSVYSVWMNPQEFDPEPAQLQSLAKLLETKPKLITHLDTKKQNREFVYLKRSLSPELAHEIKALNIPGIYLQEDYHRYYPEGEIAAQVVGFTNVDDRGQEGLELGYNQWLQGTEGKKWVIKDRLGRVISDVQTVKDQKPGNDLVLSLDRRIQYLAYRELLAGVAANQAQSGSVVVLDVKTGEILAMANVPSFNPNNRVGTTPDSYRNRAITDVFEPGSTMKAFTVASALESGKYTPDSIIDTSPGWMNLDHHLVRDEKNNGALTISQILQLSSNMGAAKLVLSIPADKLWDMLRRVGLGESTGVTFPGEQDGVLVHHNPWGAFTLATMSFGYGLSVTPLQLAHAYAVLANGGVKVPLTLTRLDAPPKGEQVISPKIAKQMLMLLESVVQAKEGTSRAAQVPGYRVAGKTGTAWRFSPKGGYDKHRYNSTFVGIAPLSQPRLVIAVVINDPRGKHYYAGEISAPIFEKIMEGTLRIMDVPPDNLGT